MVLVLVLGRVCVRARVRSLVRRARACSSHADSAIGTAGAKAMAKALRNNKSATHINLRCKWRRGSIFSSSSSMIFVVMILARAGNGHGIGIDGVKAWAGVLKKNTTLTSIDFGRKCAAFTSSSCCFAEFSNLWSPSQQARRRRRPSVCRRAQTQRVGEERRFGT